MELGGAQVQQADLASARLNFFFSSFLSKRSLKSFCRQEVNGTLGRFLDHSLAQTQT